MKYSLFLYKYEVQNTLPPRHVYDTSAAPSTHRKRRVNRNIVVSGPEEKRKKRKKRLFGGT